MWITTVSVDAAEGRLKDAFDWQTQRLRRPTEFTLLGSLDPEFVHARLILCRASENCPSTLTQRQLEVPEMEIAALRRGRFDVLPPAEVELAAYPRKLTLDPGLVPEPDIKRLHKLGFGDPEILDANNMCAHLNYVNRIANGLELESEVTADFEPYATVPE
jgi:alkylhydroperoxidase family enzyme